MLKRSLPLISPQLLKVMAEMGHAGMRLFFLMRSPAHLASGLRCCAPRGCDLLRAVIPLFELDSYAPPLVMMAAVEGDTLDPRWKCAIATRSHHRSLSGYRPYRPLCLL